MAMPRRTGLPFRHPAVLLATWFGSGLLPGAPGTWGSLAALPCAWIITHYAGAAGLGAALVAVFFAGWWAAEAMSRATGIRDAGTIVIDEVAGQWLTLLAAPLDPLAYALGFLIFRLFDIAKPWPVSWADRRLSGGFGIMADDMLAGLYAALALSGLWRMGRLVLAG